MVPSKKELLLPLFKILKQVEEMHYREVAGIIATRMNLTEGEINQGTKKTNTLLTNVSFAGTELNKKGIITLDRTGTWKITTKGKEITDIEFCNIFNVSN